MEYYDGVRAPSATGMARAARSHLGWPAGGSTGVLTFTSCTHALSKGGMGKYRSSVLYILKGRFYSDRSVCFFLVLCKCIKFEVISRYFEDHDNFTIKNISIVDITLKYNILRKTHLKNLYFIIQGVTIRLPKRLKTLLKFFKHQINGQYNTHNTQETLNNYNV